MPLTSRIYSGATDLPAMLQLLTALRPPQHIGRYPSPQDLRELLALPAVQANTRLWLDAGGRLVGFALVDHFNNLIYEFNWQAAEPACEAELIAWGVECVRRSVQNSGADGWLDACCEADETDRIALLERSGFAQQEVRSLHFVRPLDEPISQPSLPVGFSLRCAAGEAEAPALVDLHRAAFGTQNMTVEERLAMMRGPDYEPKLDLLAVASDGRLAGYCLCTVKREENLRSGRSQGSTDPVAVHPDFQGLGLACALLLTGLRLLKECGVKTAVLGTSSENIAMQRTAQSVGFRIQSETIWFSKPVPMNVEAG
jgi:mycothiol synthase